MENMSYNPLKEIDMKRIVPTELDNYYRNQLLIGYVHDMGAALQNGVGGHAGIFSSSNDLAKFMQLYLDNGMYGDERFLNESTIKTGISSNKTSFTDVFIIGTTPSTSASQVL